MNNPNPDLSAGGTFLRDKNGTLLKHEAPSRPRDDNAIQPVASPKKAAKPKARKVIAQKPSVPTKASAPVAAERTDSATE